MCTVGVLTSIPSSPPNAHYCIPVSSRIAICFFFIIIVTRSQTCVFASTSVVRTWSRCIVVDTRGLYRGRTCIPVTDDKVIRKESPEQRILAELPRCL